MAPISNLRGGKMRITKLKSAVRCISVFVTFLVATGTLYAYDSIVTGNDNPELDVKAVQEAVDKGGSVLLKGTFNFGQKGQVNIKNDIEISGESADKGSPVTKIIGGFWPFHSPLPSTDLPLPGPGPKVKIKNIHFDGAVWTPMHFPYTSGAEISGNKITNVQPFELPIKWKGGDTLWVNAGALLGTRFAHSEKFLPGGTSGLLTFENNEVDLKCANPEITMGQGAFYIWTWGATIEIKGNTFKNVSRNTIETLDNYRDESGIGKVTITDNKIITPLNGCPFPGPTSYPNGIVVGWFLDKSGGSDPSKNSKTVIMNNHIETSGELASGIISLGDGTVVLENIIVMGGGSKSKGISLLGSNGFVARNKIEGSGAWAMRALQWNELKGSENTFAWNDISEFKASSADFMCLGNNNILIGPKCNVFDKGKNNTILSKN
jgi:hypothetical protein